jgi:hypothetical protein
MAPRHPPGPCGLLAANWLCFPTAFGGRIRHNLLSTNHLPSLGLRPNWVCLTRPPKVGISQTNPGYSARNAGRSPARGLLSCASCFAHSVPVASAWASLPPRPNPGAGWKLALFCRIGIAGGISSSAPAALTQSGRCRATGLCLAELAPVGSCSPAGSYGFLSLHGVSPGGTSPRPFHTLQGTSDLRKWLWTTPPSRSRRNPPQFCSPIHASIFSCSVIIHTPRFPVK